MGPFVTPVHQGLVCPFEIERVNEGFAQSLVLELVAAGVEEPALRARRRIVRQGVALNTAVANRRKVVARRPDARGELLAEEIALAGETLEGDIAVAIEFVAHDVEIVLPALRWQLGAPPILDPFVFDEAPGIEASHPVGT